MNFNIACAFTIYLIVLSSLNVTTMDNDLDVEFTLNRSTPVTPIRCVIKDKSNVAFLTCTYPFDVRQERLNFYIQASQQTDITPGFKLTLNCVWLTNLVCVGTNGGVPLREDTINTNVTVDIPTTEAISHSFTCHLTDLIIDTDPCSLDVPDTDVHEDVPTLPAADIIQKNDSSPAENKTSSYLIALVVIVVTIAIGIVIVYVFIILKRKKRKQTNKNSEKQNTAEEKMELIESTSNNQSHDKPQYPHTESPSTDCQPVVVHAQFEQREGVIVQDMDDNTRSNTVETSTLHCERLNDENDNENTSFLKPMETIDVTGDNNTLPNAGETLPLLSESQSDDNDNQIALMRQMNNASIVSYREKDEEIAECLKNLCESSFIIPDEYLSYVHTNPTMIGPLKVDVISPMDNPVKPTNPIRQRIRDVDKTKLKIHECLSKMKQLVSPNELVAILAQTSFSLYGAGAAHLSETPMVSLDQILKEMEKFSDFVIINQQRGVLGGIVLSDHFNNPDLKNDHLKMSADKLLECPIIIKEVLCKVPKAEDVGVHTTLVLPNIIRKQFPKAFSSVPCLFKDEMETEEGVRNWWNACWASGDSRVMDVQLYRNIVYKFAVPALRAQAKLNNGATGRLTNNHETKTATANFIIYDPTKPSQYLLFPSEEKLLDFDSLDAAGHDIKILTGPPGAGKSMLIRLRALQWVSHFAASNIIILQTTKDGTAAACVLEHQLEQMLRDQECTFTPVNLSGAWERKSDLATGMTEADLIEAIESNLGLRRGSPPDAAIHIVAVEADGNVIRAVYQWLTENSQAKIRMWVAGVEVFEKLKNLPSALRRATVHVTSDHLFHGPPEQQILRLASGRDAAQTDLERDSAGGQPIKRLRHVKGLSGHDASPYPWSCARCATAICQQLKELLVGEADDGRQGLSANDVFILAKELSCEESDVSKEFSAAPLLKCLQENGYNVCTVNSDSSREHIMSIIKKTNKPPAITVSSEKYLWYLKREVIVYCESSSDADAARKVWTLHKATPTLIDIKPE